MEGSEGLKGLAKEWLGDRPGGDAPSFRLEGYDRRLSILEKILSRACISNNGLGCIEWCGPDSGNGRGGDYGRFSFEGATAAVHRTVYCIIFGPIPPKKQVDHECNNRRCFYPGHLSAKTHKQNQKLRDERRSS